MYSPSSGVDLGIGRSAAGDAGNEVDLAVDVDLLIGRAVVNDAVNRYGEIVEPAVESGKARSQGHHQLAHARRLDLYRFESAGVLRKAAQEMHDRHLNASSPVLLRCRVEALAHHEDAKATRWHECGFATESQRHRENADDSARRGAAQRRLRHKRRAGISALGIPHYAFCISVSCAFRYAESAASTRGGDIGSSVKRMPVASRTAFATAASGGTIGTSPTPRTPYGCSGFATSTRTVSIIGRSDATGMR